MAYTGNQLRRGTVWLIGPGTTMSRRPTTCPRSILAGLSWTDRPSLDVRALARIAAPERGDLSLDDLCVWLGIVIEDDDVDGEMLETYGGLLAFARAKLAGG